MALEFKRVIEQVRKMGADLANQHLNLRDEMDAALALFRASTNVDEIRERIEIVRATQVSRYRGAALLDAPIDEPLPLRIPAPQMPEMATILASDGSQIYPEGQIFPRYYLINIGLFVYYYGVEAKPDRMTIPTLFYDRRYVSDKRKRAISRPTVDARRSVDELGVLAKYAHAYGITDHPIITLLDNRLLFFVGSDVVGGNKLMSRYRQKLVRLHKEGVILGGYIDSPQNSRLIVRLLRLLDMDFHEIAATDFRKPGRFEDLTDVDLLGQVLAPGERSAILVPNSPINYMYRTKFGGEFEMAAFYMNVARRSVPHIVRVDLPMWVARDKVAVEILHSILLHQCGLQGRNPYPYALTRADELAYVSGREKQQLDEIIRYELRKNDMRPEDQPVKQRTKELARADQTDYRLER